VSATDRVRIGTLGAARIAPGALIKPARKVADAEVVAVAARDPARAEKFARKHKIPKVHATYDDVIGDPDVDAIYNPLPNGLHAEWTLKALAAGQHV
jgi:predicted dehydrogenase